MMPIDPSIAMGVRPLEVPNPLAQYGQVAQIQAAQRQGEMSQMQLEDLKNDRIEMKNLQAEIAAKGGNPDMGQYAAMLMRTSDPKNHQLGIELNQKWAQQQQADAVLKQLYPELPSLFGAPAGTPATTGAPAAAPMQPGALGMAPEPALQRNALAPTTPQVATNQLATPSSGPQQLSPSGKTRQQLEGLIMAGNSNPYLKGIAETAKLELAEMIKPPIYHNVPGVGLVDPRTRQTIMPAVESKPNEQKLYELAVSQGFKGSFRDFHLQNIREARPPAQPRPEQPPVAVVDPATNKIVYVTREEALANRMTPATSIEGIAPKEIQKREAAYPQVTAAFKSAVAENEQLASDLEKLKSHPGLSGMTGTIYGRTPSMMGPSKEAKALYDKIVARGGFQKLTDMRQSSPTGAALGPVSDSEGKYLRAAFGALDPTQNTDSFQKAIDQAITELHSSTGRLQDAYGMTYDYRNGQSTSASKPGAHPADIQAILDAQKAK